MFTLIVGAITAGATLGGMVGGAVATVAGMSGATGTAVCTIAGACSRWTGRWRRVS